MTFALVAVGLAVIVAVLAVRQARVYRRELIAERSERVRLAQERAAQSNGHPHTGQVLVLPGDRH